MGELREGKKRDMLPHINVKVVYAAKLKVGQLALHELFMYFRVFGVTENNS
jgi:hypothetical protein